MTLPGKEPAKREMLGTSNKGPGKELARREMLGTSNKGAASTC